MSTDATIRSDVASGLRFAPPHDERIDALVVRLLRDRSWPVRSEAVGAACSRNMKGLDDRFEALMKDRSWIVRTDAIEAIVNLDLRSKFPAVVRALEDDSQIVRRYAAWGVGMRGTAKHRSVLRAAMATDDLPLQYNVLIALYRLGDRRALEGMSRLGVTFDVVPNLFNAVRDLLMESHPDTLWRDFAPVKAILARGVKVDPLFARECRRVVARIAYQRRRAGA